MRLLIQLRSQLLLILLIFFFLAFQSDTVPVFLVIVQLRAAVGYLLKDHNVGSVSAESVLLMAAFLIAEGLLVACKLLLSIVIPTATAGVPLLLAVLIIRNSCHKLQIMQWLYWLIGRRLHFGVLGGHLPICDQLLALEFA